MALESNIVVESVDEFTDSFFIYDVVIIGAGVAGLYAAYCCGISGLSCCVIDSLPQAGGQCVALYPEKNIYGVPGFINVKAKDYIEILSNQCLGYAKETFFNQKVQHISKTKTGKFCVKTAENTIFSKHLIIASGIGDMKPNVPNNVKGLSTLKQDSDFVQHYCMKLDIYKGKNVIIAGGGDSAVDFAINIAPIAKKVFLIHRKDKLTCEACKLSELRKLCNSSKLELSLENQILEIEDNSKRIVRTTKKEFEVDHIVFCYGFLPSCNLIDGLTNLGMHIENGVINSDINTMETAIENCYAAGDVASYVNKKKNIVPCYFEADRAVRSIKSKISKEVSNHAVYKG
ncbi:MAG: NAD(P)/FAD-dependent oxidoreductase [Holosporales bacterium]|jgi:thioredoxin reductase (NADPH)|nr:NAD(P)/FAD-dependent oxidoreductase [Holosporales bacterium]